MKKIGFFKKSQGIFSPEYIDKIIDALRISFAEDTIITDLDFRQGYVLNGKAYIGDRCLNDLDVYFWHDTVKPRDWMADNHALNVLSVMENDVHVINSSQATRVVNDKFLSHALLAQHNLPVAEHALVRVDDKIGIKHVFTSLGSHVLLKPRFGGWGLGIAQARSLDELMSIIEYMMSFQKHESEQILLERYYENDPQKWISVVVFGDKVLFGYKKPLLGNSNWKIYDPEKQDGKGQQSQYINPPEELKEIALQAKQILKKDIVGFDFIHTKYGYKIIDENGRPGLYPKCIEAASIDIKQEIVKLIKQKIDAA